MKVLIDGCGGGDDSLDHIVRPTTTGPCSVRPWHLSFGVDSKNGRAAGHS
jgi:hypothetical protein